MKVLVVDDDVDFRGLAGALLRRSFPRAAVTGYDPESQGLPPEEFPWADYDVVLLDHELRAEHTGLDWLRRFSRLRGFPAIIFTTGSGDVNVAARAIKLGADEYLNKSDVSAGRLGELVSSVIAARTVTADESDPVLGTVPGDDEEDADCRIVPGYTLRRLLGCGGTADVYLAERLDDGLTVVVKVLREAMANNDLAIQRLEMEALCLADMDSPCVVRVYEHGLERGRAYMAMEFLGHGDLRGRISDGLTVARVLSHARAVARGLATVHAHGIAHRDVKPGNVMFRYDDSLALTDFGIAKSFADEQELTVTGSVVGTPSYMSPEQCEGRPADMRSDLYSYGVLLFEMLTGARPFTADSVSMLFMQQVEAPVPPLPRELADFQPVVERLMEKCPARRYPSADAVVRDLDAVAHARGIAVD